MAQGDQQQFCLRWNDFQTNMVSSFKHLRDEKSFTDVTLACLLTESRRKEVDSPKVRDSVGGEFGAPSPN